MSRLDGVVINGDEERRYAGNMNMSFAYVEGESLIMGLKVRLPRWQATDGKQRRSPLDTVASHVDSTECTALCASSISSAWSLLRVVAALTV
jgi:hypothetical protein